MSVLRKIGADIPYIGHGDRFALRVLDKNHGILENLKSVNLSNVEMYIRGSGH
jgi:hypothetical protein